MSKPLVVQVMWSLERGGAERLVFDISKRLQDDFDVEVIALGGGSAMVPDFRQAGIPLKIAPDTRPGFDRKRLLDFILSSLQGRRPDIWHTHLGGDIWGGYAARKLKLHPWFITAHSHEPDLNLITRLARRRAYRTADQIVCISDSVRNAISKLYGVRRDRMSVIPVGIEPSRFPERPPHPVGDRPRLVSVGRLSSEKGHAFLLQALARLKRPWELTLVGDGPERQDLERLCGMLGILPRVRFTGSVSNPAQFLQEADLFVFPSLHEGQGIALLEAAAAHVPVLASDLPIFHEAFDDQSMVFARAGDSAAWTERLDWCLSNYHLMLPRADRARQIVLDRFTIDRTVEAYKTLYLKSMK